MASVHLIVGAQVDQEDVIAVPADEDAEIVVHAERPVVRQVALQLVRPEEGILEIGCEPPKGRPEQ